MPKLNFTAEQGWVNVPATASRMGHASVIHPDAVFADPSIGPGVDLPDMPDFEALAEEQCRTIASYDTFHETAIGFFAPRLDEEAQRYCFELRRVFEEYASHLDTTYRAALTDKLEQAKSRLASMPCLRSAEERDTEREEEWL